MITRRLRRCLNDAVKRRAMRSGGGSLLGRRGRFATPAEWQARREGHDDRLKRNDQWLSEHAGSSSPSSWLAKLPDGSTRCSAP